MGYLSACYNDDHRSPIVTACQGRDRSTEERSRGSRASEGVPTSTSKLPDSCCSTNLLPDGLLGLASLLEKVANEVDDLRVSRELFSSAMISEWDFEVPGVPMG